MKRYTGYTRKIARLTDLVEMGVDYIQSYEVTKNGGREIGYRYRLSQPLTKVQKAYFSQFKNVIFQSGHLEYAPEIKTHYIVLMKSALKD